MKLTIEPLPIFVLENKNVIKINDPFLLGIYTFIKMIIENQEHKVYEVISKIQSHFNMETVEIVKAIDILHELGVIRGKDKK
jgi:hypothetical protein